MINKVSKNTICWVHLYTPSIYISEYIALQDLVLFAQFKNMKITPGGMFLLVKFQGKTAILLKVTSLHGCFTHF